MPIILFWFGNLRSFRSSLPFSRVRLLHLALIFNGADNPLLDWKLFTNTFCTSSLTLSKKFNETFFSAREQHVCQQIGKKNSAKWTKIWSLSRDKADIMKVSRKITTQHGPTYLPWYQVITPSQIRGLTSRWCNPMVKLHCACCRVGSFSFIWYQMHKSF